MALAVAHRGDPHAHVENTVPAQLAAVAQGADMVEVDLRLTRDEQVVVVHDPTLRRVWGVAESLTELTLDQVRSVSSGRYTIPTFAEVLSSVRAPLMVDLPDSAAAVPAAELVEKHDAVSRSTFVTSDVAALQRIREVLPQAGIGLTWAQHDLPDPAVLEALRAEFFNPSWQFLTLHPDIVERMHDDGYLVSTWTVDSPTNMARLLQMGVDAVVTNRLSFLLPLVDRYPDPRGGPWAEGMDRAS